MASEAPSKSLYRLLLHFSPIGPRLLVPPGVFDYFVGNITQEPWVFFRQVMGQVGLVLVEFFVNQHLSAGSSAIRGKLFVGERIDPALLNDLHDFANGDLRWFLWTLHINTRDADDASHKFQTSFSAFPLRFLSLRRRM